LRRCEFDCDKDSDCASGLLCADKHKGELAALGYDKRKANCGNVGRSNEEVCFDASLLEETPNEDDGSGLGFLLFLRRFFARMSLFKKD
jgi:hypothetical protein